MAADHCERDFQIHPPSQDFTSAYLICSLGNSLLNTLYLRGVTVYSNGPWVQGSLSRPGGEGETNVAPHSPGQNQVYSPRNCPHARGIQTKVTIITRYNIIELLTMAYSYDLCRPLQNCPKIGVPSLQ